MENEIKLNLGSGYKPKKNYINIDCVQLVDPKIGNMVDLILDLEKDKLPFEDNSVDEILAENILEHIENLKLLMNECNRVLKPDRKLIGIVPIAGSNASFKDPTHKRFFVLDTFTYFIGEHTHFKNKPSRPKYADYGFIAWDYDYIKKDENEDLINFSLKKK